MVEETSLIHKLDVSKLESCTFSFKISDFEERKESRSEEIKSPLLKVETHDLCGSYLCIPVEALIRRKMRSGSRASFNVSEILQESQSSCTLFDAKIKKKCIHIQIS
jgi:hypothetical protein